MIKADGGSMGLLKSLYKHRESLNAVFSYDDMVNFQPNCVKQYLVDSYHVLKSGGKALYHQSNHTKNKGSCFNHNPEWRNYMSQELFAAYARQAGFNVVPSQVLSSAAPDSDCLPFWRSLCKQ
jgi:cyclopropane fatty-acyl-phospholipid synthase-like methyltransferase